MSVRVAGKSDVSQLLELYRDLVGDAELAGTSELLKVMEHPGTQIFCDEQDEQLSAMVTLHILPNVTQAGRPYAVIENVVTRQNMRGQGAGRRVIEAAIEHAWALDAYKIMLMTGQTAEAKGVYERLGFRSDEKWAMTLRRAPLRSGR